MTTTVAPAAKDADVEARVDVASLTHQLLGRWGDLRLFSRAIVGDPRFQKIEGLPVAEHRERVLEQLKLLVTEAKVLRAFPERLGGADDAGGSLAGFEELVAGDPSMQIKGGVQWGLFASAILHLGTPEQHDRLLPGAMTLAVAHPPGGGNGLLGMRERVAVCGGTLRTGPRAGGGWTVAATLPYDDAVTTARARA